MTQPTLDLRPIRHKPIDINIAADLGGSFNISIQCNLEIGFNEQYLLWYDEVDQWLWKWIEWHPGLDTWSTENFFGNELNYSIAYDLHSDIPKLQRSFAWWVAHLMTCIHWEVCPCCEQVHFTFYDPIELDIEELNKCTTCEPYEIEFYEKLHRAHRRCKIDDDTYNAIKDAAGVLDKGDRIEDHLSQLEIKYDL